LSAEILLETTFTWPCRKVPRGERSRLEFEARQLPTSEICVRFKWLNVQRQAFPAPVWSWMRVGFDPVMTIMVRVRDQNGLSAMAVSP